MRNRNFSAPFALECFSKAMRNNFALTSGLGPSSPVKAYQSKSANNAMGGTKSNLNPCKILRVIQPNPTKSKVKNSNKPVA